VKKDFFDESLKKQKQDFWTTVERVLRCSLQIFEHFVGFSNFQAHTFHNHMAFNWKNDFQSKKSSTVSWSSKIWVRLFGQSTSSSPSLNYHREIPFRRLKPTSLRKRQWVNISEEIQWISPFVNSSLLSVGRVIIFPIKITLVFPFLLLYNQIIKNCEIICLLS
jgi:hypothetical protein